MKVKSRNIRNFSITFILITFLFVVAYFLCNNDTMMKLLPVKFSDKVSQGSILNKRYNKQLEGSVLDNIYDFDATLISLRQTRILHKKLSFAKNISLIGSKAPLKLEGIEVKHNSNNKNPYKYYITRPKDNFTALLRSNTENKELLIAMPQVLTSQYDPEKKTDNRFQGLVNQYKTDESTKKVLDPGSTALLSSIKNWDSSREKKFYKLGHNLHYKMVKPNISKDTLLNYKITRSSQPGTQLKLEIVQDFSSDPLNTVIENVLIPGGLPKTAANVDAVARAMGLPSGSLGSSYALAGSLGLTVEELSDPKTKLSSQIVSAINKNKEYIGSKLDVNNTTLSDYYYQALKSKLSEK